MLLLIPLIGKIFRLCKIPVLCCVLLLAGMSFNACRAKKNVKTSMGWLSHKKLGKYQAQHKRKSKKRSRLKKEAVQHWYRDWIKGDKKK